MSERKQLLIIDDDPDFVEGIQAIVKKQYDLDVAHNPKDGMAALAKKKYDLLLLDIMMGRGAEGVMVFRKMSKDPELRKIPVLVMTGIREQIAFLFGSQALHPHFVEVDELIEKPVKPQFLLERIEALIKEAGRKKTAAKAPAAKK